MTDKRIFILSYQGINELDKWFDPSQFNIPVHIIDNGKQNIPDRLKRCVIHSTKENIFCSGGLNLCAKIGFNFFKSQKILLTQDDAQFSMHQVQQVLDMSTPSTISGGRNDIFFYCFLGLHREVYSRVGEFDENYLFGTCEDNDYFYRAHLEQIQHITADTQIPNKNISSPAVSWRYGNYEYLIDKWGAEKPGKWSMYSYTTPFNGEKRPKIRPEYWSYFKTPYSTFMSDFEYARFLTNQV